MADTGPPPTILSPERPGNQKNYGPNGTPQISNAAPPKVAAPNPSAAPSNGPGIGLYFVGALVVVSLADTRAAPVVVAFLAAAAIYNLNYLLTRYSGSNP